MKVKMTLIAALATLASLSPLANAQTFYAAPPQGFDVTKAAPADLDRYGLPPRPDPSQAVAYAAWLHLVTTPQTRIENPEIEVTNIINGSVRNLKTRGAAKSNSTASTSDNWSGVAITVPNGNFTANNSAAYTQFLIPKMGADNCTYAPYDMSWWVGFDGLTSGDVLQAGVLNTNCTAKYVVWYEWFEAGCTGSSKTLPCYQTNVSVPATAGDYLAIEIWYTTAAPNGHAYFMNYTAGKSLSIAFNQPSGTAAYAGNSVEWIAERPGLVTSTGSTLTNLANYVAQASDVDYATDGTNTYYPGSAPSGDTIYDITMTCPPWDPTTSCSKTTDLSYPYVPGGWSIWTFVEGPAYQP
jgi:hypothetical protein